MQERLNVQHVFGRFPCMVDMLIVDLLIIYQVPIQVLSLVNRSWCLLRTNFGYGALFFDFSHFGVCKAFSKVDHPILDIICLFT